MVRLAGISALLLASVLSGCAPHPVFPPKVIQDVNAKFDFAAWAGNPSDRQRDKVEVGGKIMQVVPAMDGLLIIGERLPIVEHPAYGPTEQARHVAGAEFAFRFPGKIEPTALVPGNRFILVGTTQGAKTVEIEGSRKTLPYLEAQCVHIWKTQGREISDFPYVGAGYYTLEEQTYCASALGTAER